jgi:hypothetical protein
MMRLLVPALLLTLSGCWSSYAQRAAVHAELLGSMTAKLISLVESGRPPALERMGEYVYPAQRAEEFLHSYSGYSEYVSYRALKELTARYRALVQRVDAGRAAGVDWRAEIDALRAEHEQIRRLATEVTQSLEQRR